MSSGRCCVKIRVSVAVAAGAVLVLSGCGGGADDVQASPTTTTAATSTTTTAPTTTEPTSVAPTPEPPVETSTDTAPTSLVPVEYEENESYYFSSPDGQFQCGIVQLPMRTEAGCEGVTDPVPPTPDDCMVNFGHGMRVVDSGEGEFLCSGGPVYLSADGDSTALPENSELSELGYTCSATAVAVTCVNDATGHGFTIASDTNETF